MLRVLCATLLVSIISISSAAQVLCVSNKAFSYPELPLRAGIGASFLVQLDIQEFAPRNIHISALDDSSSQFVDMFNKATVENLNRFLFLKDTTGFQLIVRYSVRHFSQLSRGFAEILGINEVHFVAQSLKVDVSIEYGVLPPNPEIDSVFIDTTVPYKSGKAKPSDILLERMFSDEKGSTINLRNNYPDLEQELISIAGTYSKGAFLARGSNARHFFLKCRVERNLPDCGTKQIF
jgi:hypothetical protein